MYNAVPESIGPIFIDDFECINDGVWYPDQSNIRLVWKGGKNTWDRHGSNKEFNPFKIGRDLTGEKVNVLKRGQTQINFHFSNIKRFILYILASDFFL